MRSELMRMHSEMGTTIIYVTHDQVEALTMSTKIALFKEGVLSQVATPMEIYMNPVDLTAAEFIGNPRINLIEGRASFDGSRLKTVTDVGTHIFDKETMTGIPVTQNKEFSCVIGFRPEQVVLSRQKREGSIEAKVYSCQSAGSETLIMLQVGNCEFLAKRLGIHSYKMNSTVYLHIDPEKINVYDEESTELIKYAKTDEIID